MRPAGHEARIAAGDSAERRAYWTEPSNSAATKTIQILDFGFFGLFFFEQRESHFFALLEVTFGGHSG